MEIACRAVVFPPRTSTFGQVLYHARTSPQHVPMMIVAKRLYAHSAHTLVDPVPMRPTTQWRQNIDHTSITDMVSCHLVCSRHITWFTALTCKHLSTQAIGVAHKLSATHLLLPLPAKQVSAHSIAANRVTNATAISSTRRTLRATRGAPLCSQHHLMGCLHQPK